MQVENNRYTSYNTKVTPDCGYYTIQQRQLDQQLRGAFMVSC